MSDTYANLRAMDSASDAASPKDQRPRNAICEFEKPSPLKVSMQLSANSDFKVELSAPREALSNTSTTVPPPTEQKPSLEGPDVAFDASLAACLRAQAR